jgi:hypothetical protein
MTWAGPISTSVLCCNLYHRPPSIASQAMWKKYLFALPDFNMMLEPLASEDEDEKKEQLVERADNGTSRNVMLGRREGVPIPAVLASTRPKVKPHLARVYLPL